MAKITLGGNQIETIGELPAANSIAPDFVLTGTDLTDVSLKDYAGKNIVLNIFPSIDTQVCATSVRRFNAEADGLKNTVILCISADLPFALSRFCGAEGLNNVIPLSVFRYPEFGKDYGVTILTGKMKGLLSRAIVIIAPDGKIAYTEQVPEIANEPDYESALKALNDLIK